MMPARSPRRRCTSCVRDLDQRVEGMSVRLDDLRAEAKKREAEELSTWRAYARAKRREISLG